MTSAQTTASQQQDDVVRFRSNEVRLDIVVTDKKGRPIKDLKASDFEVSEDGVTQKVESFRFVTKRAEAVDRKANDDRNKPTDTTAPVPPPRRSSPAVTALVFDRLSPEARSLARKAGLAYAQDGMASGDFTGVFGIDQNLRTVQAFTDNQELVKEGVERITGATPSTYASGAAGIRANTEQSSALSNQISAGAGAASAAGAARDSAGASGAGAEIGQAAVAQKLLEMQNDMSDHYERLQRDQEGYATINGLLAVISPMQNLPGRKTIIFFSEGLKLPPSVSHKFPSVIDAANRANVSIYSIDAAGLRIESGTAEAARELNSLAGGSMGRQGAGERAGGGGPLMRALERNEDLLRFDPRSGLGPLSDETGGFLINNTNDLAAGIRRIDDDISGYYFLTYVPQNKEYDGRFRRIGVKVSRPNVEIQSRKGYYALESVGDLPVLDFEAPAIAAARNWRGKPGQDSLLSGALTYPVTGKNGLTLIVAEAPLAAFKFAPDKDNKSYTTDFSIVAVVRDSSDRLVQKLSQHYALTGPVQNLDNAKKGSVLFYREAQLPPGKYQIQVVAFDAATGTANVNSTPLEIAATDDSRLRLSAVAVLKRAERLSAEEQKRDQPFRFGELLVYPNLGERIDRNTSKQLAYFFTAWPAKGSTKPLQMTLEILQNKQLVGKTSGELPAPDEPGQIKYAGSFAIDKLQPGVFELKISVSDGVNSVSRSTSFVIGS
ncbi:MAG TPA: VWA domain-containing protein [Pyrinomonadaceae bacterium]|nr:VWA domain-containing protein [Pyrinomonadaceae bacterium]